MRTILIADDHVLMREALMHLLRCEFNGVAFECASGFHEVEQKLRLWRADADNHAHADGAVVLDLRMPGMNGLHSVRELLALAQPHPIIVYSEVDSSVTKAQLLQLGVFAVECKSEGAQSLLDTLHRALHLPSAPTAVAASTAPTPLSGEIGVITLRSGIKHQANIELTSRQMDMLRALHRGLPNKLIAREYGVALGTVKNHLFILYERLGVKSRSEALNKTREWFL